MRFRSWAFPILREVVMPYLEMERPFRITNNRSECDVRRSPLW